MKSIVWRKILECLSKTGVSKLSEKVFLKVNYSFKGIDSLAMNMHIVNAYREL